MSRVVDDILYTKLDENNAIVGRDYFSRAIDYSIERDIIIESYVTIDGKIYKVTEIGEASFRNTSITGIIIPNTVNAIRDLAFAYTYKMKYIVIQGNLNSIGKWVLTDQIDLSNITYCGYDEPNYIYNINTGWTISKSDYIKLYVLNIYKNSKFVNKNVIKTYMPYCVIQANHCFCKTIKRTFSPEFMLIFSVFLLT